MGDNIRERTFTSMIWRFMERCGAQIVSFIVSIVLARLLDPEHYGSVALITIIINILQVFIDSGMGNALIQKKDADEIDFSSVFFFNMIMCILLYLLLFVCAPFIAVFYNDTELTWPIRVLGLTLIVSGVKNIQQSYVSKNFLFKKFFFSTLGGTLASAVIGIWMAYQGYGIWALVAQQLSNTVVDTIVLFFTVRWRPKFKFSFTRLKSLFSYGWKILVASLVNTVYEDIRQLLIGKVYTSSDLAYYNKGKQFPKLIVTNVNTSIDSVLLPAMSSEQDRKDRVKSMTRRSIRVSSYVIWPMMFGLIAVSTPLVTVLLTEKWLSCVPFLCILSISMGVQPLQTANLSAIKALGRSDLFLKLEIIKKSVGLVIVLITLPFGTIAIAWGAVAYSIFANIVNAFPNRKLLNYSYFEQMKDIMPYILLSAVMCVITYPISLLGLNDILCLVIQVLVGVVIYIIGSIIFKFDIFFYLLDVIKKVFKRNKDNQAESDCKE